VTISNQWLKRILVNPALSFSNTFSKLSQTGEWHSKFAPLFAPPKQAAQNITACDNNGVKID